MATPLAKQHCMLVVGDNPDDIRLFELAVKSYPIIREVITKPGGAEAIDYLQRCRSGEVDFRFPSLIFLDLKMPGLDGLDVMTWIRSQDVIKQIPVVLISASAGQADLAEGYARGINSFIRKPLDFITFRNQLGKIIQYWLVTNESPFP